MTQADPFAEMMSAWKKTTDEFLKTWNTAIEGASESGEQEEAVRQARDTYLGTQANLAEARKKIAEPAVEMAGGVPLSEFRRLMDQMNTVLLRLDRIDDQLTELVAKKRRPRKKKAD
jgi:predicted  nucleic acid-binding Zn-ribbon protein